MNFRLPCVDPTSGPCLHHPNGCFRNLVSNAPKSVIFKRDIHSKPRIIENNTKSTKNVRYFLGTYGEMGKIRNPKVSNNECLWTGIISEIPLGEFCRRRLGFDHKRRTCGKESFRRLASRRASSGCCRGVPGHIQRSGKNSFVIFSQGWRPVAVALADQRLWGFDISTAG